jgi:hypothetical protein
MSLSGDPPVSAGQGLVNGTQFMLAYAVDGAPAPSLANAADVLRARRKRLGAAPTRLSGKPVTAFGPTPGRCWQPGARALAGSELQTQPAWP